MFVELPNELILVAGCAFLLGWILATIASNLGARYRARKRDPRDDRIRSLEAELRIAQSESLDSRTDLEKLEDQLKETTIGLERRDNVISEQQSKLEAVSSDLKGSVLKTRQLRTELADRATESVHAEAKIREVETELSVAQASTDMIATGVLDYSFVPDNQDPDEVASDNDDAPDEVSEASS
jgi:septal ring factor EnvC (AmiA/AmiB activator)